MAAKNLGRLLIIASVLLAGGTLSAQDTLEKKADPLLAAKIVSVEPMPRDLDKWILEDLRAWRKYRLTAESEGANLVIRAEGPEKRPDYEIRGGIPQPRRRKEKDSSMAICSRQNLAPVLTINVTDWITGDEVWYAHLFDKRAPKGEADSLPAGPHADLFVHGMTPDQIAQRVVSKLREYVTQLEAPKVSKPPAESSKQ